MYSNNVNTINKGYVFDEATKKLSSYELISADFHLGDEPVTYKCKLGGKETEITTSELKVYESDNDFKIGKTTSRATNSYHIKDVLPLKSKEVALAFIDGKPTDVPTSEILLTFHANGHRYTSDTKTYKSLEDLYMFNDLHIIEEDGSERIVECPAAKLKLTDEQKKLVDVLRETFSELKKSKCTIYYDLDYNYLLAINTEKVNTVVDYHQHDEARLDVTECAVPILERGEYISYINCDDSILIEKEE